MHEEQAMLTVEKRHYGTNHRLAWAVERFLEGAAVDCTASSALPGKSLVTLWQQYPARQKGHCHSQS